MADDHDAKAGLLSVQCWFCQSVSKLLSKLTSKHDVSFQLLLMLRRQKALFVGTEVLFVGK